MSKEIKGKEAEKIIEEFKITQYERSFTIANNTKNVAVLKLSNGYFFKIEPGRYFNGIYSDENGTLITNPGFNNFSVSFEEEQVYGVGEIEVKE